MRRERAGAVTGAVPGLPALAESEALRCRAGEMPVRCPLDLVITIPRPPAPPVILPLPETEAFACVGGDGDIIRLLIDWTTGIQPAPPQLPPTHI